MSADDFAQGCLAESAAPFMRRKRGREDAPLGVSHVGIIRLAFGDGGWLLYSRCQRTIPFAIYQRVVRVVREPR